MLVGILVKGRKLAYYVRLCVNGKWKHSNKLIVGNTTAHRIRRESWDPVWLSHVLCRLIKASTFSCRDPSLQHAGCVSGCHSHFVVIFFLFLISSPRLGWSRKLCRRSPSGKKQSKEEREFEHGFWLMRWQKDHIFSIKHFCSSHCNWNT